MSFSGRKSAHHGNTEKVIVPSHYSFINSDFFSRAFSLVEKRLPGREFSVASNAARST